METQPSKTRGFPDAARIEKYVRDQGLEGPIDQAFIKDMRWSMFATSVSAAIEERGEGPAEAEAYRDRLLELSTEEARALPADDPFRLVMTRAIELMNARIDGYAED